MAQPITFGVQAIFGMNPEEISLPFNPPLTNCRYRLRFRQAELGRAFVKVGGVIRDHILICDGDTLKLGPEIGRNVRRAQ